MTTMSVVGECFFWYRLTRVVLNKFNRAVKRLCVCVVICGCDVIFCGVVVVIECSLADVDGFRREFYSITHLWLAYKCCDSCLLSYMGCCCGRASMKGAPSLPLSGTGLRKDEVQRMNFHGWHECFDPPSVLDIVSFMTGRMLSLSLLKCLLQVSNTPALLRVTWKRELEVKMYSR